MRCLEKTSAKSWYSLGISDRLGELGVGAELCGEGDRANRKQWELQCMLHPDSKPVDQSSLGL